MVIMTAKISKREGEENLQKEAQNRVGGGQESTTKFSDPRSDSYESYSEVDEYDSSEKSQIPVKLKYVKH